MSTEQEGIRKTSGQHTLRRPADDIVGRPNLRVKAAGNRLAQRPASRAAGGEGAPRPVVLAPAAAAAAIASAPTAAAAPAALAPAATAVAPASAPADAVPVQIADSAPASASSATADAELAAAATIIVEPAPEAEAPVAEAAPAGAEEPVITADDEPEQMAAEEPRKASKLPRIDPTREPSLYATHRSAPANEEAERAQLAALTGQKVKVQERQISTGFLLGAGLIALLLVGGVVIARMENHVRRLDNRIGLLEQIQLRTVAVAPRHK